MNKYTIHKIEKVNYTFNYDGRTSSSFSHALNGLEKMLEFYDTKIPLNIIFPTSNLIGAQEDQIDELLINSKRKPIFHTNTEKDIA